MASTANTPRIATEEAAHLLLEDYAKLAQIHHTPCASGSLVWRRWGEGEPVMLLHGSHGYWAHWIHNIPALMAKYSLWLPDLPGMGESAEPETLTHAGIFEPLAAGMRQLSIGKASLVGFSYGGMIATNLAASHPDLVRSLIIVGTGGLDTPLGPLNLRSMKDLTPEERYEANLHNLAELMLHDRAAIDPLAVHIHSSGARRNRINVRPLVLPDNVVRVLPRVTTPVSAIWGEHDAAHPAPAMQEAALRSQIADCRFAVVPDAGHWCMFEQPDHFNAILADMLDYQR